MPDKPEEDYGLRVRCGRCKAEHTLNFGRWPVRIVGAIDAICPHCGNRVTYVGQFGQDIEAMRLAADLNRAKAAAPAKCEKREGEDGE